MQYLREFEKGQNKYWQETVAWSRPLKFKNQQKGNKQI